MAVKNVIKVDGTKKKGKKAAKNTSESEEVESLKSEKKGHKLAVEALAKKKNIEVEVSKQAVKTPAKKKKKEVEDSTPLVKTPAKKKKEAEDGTLAVEALAKKEKIEAEDDTLLVKASAKKKKKETEDSTLAVKTPAKKKKKEAEDSMPAGKAPPKKKKIEDEDGTPAVKAPPKKKKIEDEDGTPAVKTPAKKKKKETEVSTPLVKTPAKKKKIETEDSTPLVKAPAKKKKIETENGKPPTTDSAKLKKKKLKAETTKTSPENAGKKTKNPVTEETKAAMTTKTKKNSKSKTVEAETTNEVTEEVEKPIMEKPRKKKLKKSIASAPIAKTTKKKVVTKKANIKTGKKTVKDSKPKAKPKELVKGSGIQRKVVEQALKGVRLLEEQRRSKAENTKDIFGDDEEDTLVYLQVGMLKVAQLLPSFRHIVRPVRIKIYLPHSVVSDNSNVLLITKDSEDAKDIRSDHTENLYHYQYLLRRCGAAKHISEVITLKQLKVEFKEYEAKRHLSNRNDVVLCDDTILFRLPKFLGKHFYGKRKFPIPVNLKSKNLLSEVEQCLRAQILWLPMKGDSGLMKIGRLDQSNEQIMENIKSVVEIMQSKFPGGWGNVKVLHLKTEKTKSIPFFINLNSPNSVKNIHPKPLSSKPIVYGEVTTAYGNTYAVCPQGRVTFVKRPGTTREPTEKEAQENTSEMNDVPEEEIEEAEDPVKSKTKRKTAVDETDESAKTPEAAVDEESAEKDNEEINFDEFEIPDFDELEDTKAKKKRKGTSNKGDMSDKKAVKGKKKKKKEEEEELDFDLYLDSDDGELDKIEREYLKSLREDQAGQEQPKMGSEDEYDDWAEDSDQDMEDMEM